MKSGLLEEVKRVDLTEFEVKNTDMDPSISGKTWFKDDTQSTKEHVRAQLKFIVLKNPWLLGRLKKSR